MLASEDFERFYIRYTAEAMSRIESICFFCSKNEILYNLF